eukprot:2128525-Amphidinium_carterae.1
MAMHTQSSVKTAEHMDEVAMEAGAPVCVKESKSSCTDTHQIPTSQSYPKGPGTHICFVSSTLDTSLYKVFTLQCL